jgi:hypothetical protein
LAWLDKVIIIVAGAVSAVAGLAKVIIESLLFKKTC